MVSVGCGIQGENQTNDRHCTYRIDCSYNVVEFKPITDREVDTKRFIDPCLY